MGKHFIEPLSGSLTNMHGIPDIRAWIAAICGVVFVAAGVGVLRLVWEDADSLMLLAIATAAGVIVFYLAPYLARRAGRRRGR